MSKLNSIGDNSAVLISAPSIGHRRGSVGFVDDDNLRIWLILNYFVDE